LGESDGQGVAAGELAMSAADLARWDLAIIDRKVLKPSSYNSEAIRRNASLLLYYALASVTMGSVSTPFQSRHCHP
jgi:hypothetical protein